jgi:hypothetical protein
MRKIFYYCLVATLIFTSCQKGLNYSLSSPQDTTSNNNNGRDTGNAITGTWNFLSMHVSMRTTARFHLDSAEDKTISKSNYTTQNNTGTLVIDDSVITVSNLSYTVNSTVRGYIYKNNVLTDSSKMPFSFSLPAVNTSGKYKLIGSDSIYFPEGSIMTISGTSSTAQPSGAKLKIIGDTLKITQTVRKDTTEAIGDTSYHVIKRTRAAILFKRQ